MKASDVLRHVSDDEDHRLSDEVKDDLEMMKLDIEISNWVRVIRIYRSSCQAMMNGTKVSKRDKEKD